MQGDKDRTLRPRRFTLQQRLLLFWLGSLCGAVILVGVVFTYQANLRIQDDARAKLQETMAHVRDALVAYEAHLGDIAQVLSRQGDIIASSQSILAQRRSAPKVLAVEKARLADELSLRLGESHLDFIAVLDLHGRLNAFAERLPADSEMAREGETGSVQDRDELAAAQRLGRPRAHSTIIKGYQNGPERAPSLFVNRTAGSDFHVFSEGQIFTERVLHLSLQSSLSDFYVADGAHLYRVVARTLLERSLRGQSRLLGSLIVARRIDADFLKGAVARSRVKVSYFVSSALHNVGTLRAPAAVREAFARISSLPDMFSSQSPRPVIEGGAYFLEGGKIPLADGRWAYVFAGIGKTEVLQEIKVFTLASFEAMILIAAFVLPIGIFLLRHLITRPLALLREGAQEVSAGRYGALLDFPPGDELGDLAQSFNRMSDSVRDRETELQALSSELEDLVRERTRALEREMAERARVQAMLKTVIDNLVDAIVTTDAKGTILSVNPAGLKMFGYTHDELAGRDVGILMPAEMAAHHGGYMRDFKGSERSKVIGVGRQLEGVRKDGTRFPMEVAISVFVIDEQRYFTGILRDITERKKVETDLLDAKARAERASRAKSKLLSSVSHELRTPMNAILGFGELLKMDDASPLSADQRTYVTQIVDAGTHLLSLIDRVLELADLQNETMTLSPRVLDPSVIVEACLARITLEAETRNLTVHNACRQSEITDIFVDPTGFKAVLDIFLLNALRCTRSDGEIAVRCRRTDAGKVRFSVYSKGCLLSEDSFEDLFHQGQDDDDDGLADLGADMSLIQAKKIATAMNCGVGLEKAPDDGTAVWVDVDPAPGS